MELAINKESFLDEFLKVKSIENRKAKDRSEGFKYLHEATTKKLAEGKEFKVGDIDFTKFTYGDLEEYLEYYEKLLEPKIKKANSFFEVLKKAVPMFSPAKFY